LSKDVLLELHIVSGKRVYGVGDMGQILDSQRQVGIPFGRDEAERLSECNSAAYGKPDFIRVFRYVCDDSLGLLDLVDKDVNWNGRSVPAEARRKKARLTDGKLQYFFEKAFEVRAGGE
jgi:hypothetical protein